MQDRINEHDQDIKLAPMQTTAHDVLFHAKGRGTEPI